MENQKKNVELDISSGVEVERRSDFFRDRIVTYWRKRSIR
jgi:hypothetical protein